MIEQASKLTKSIAESESLANFEYLVEKHEELVSKTLALPKVKVQYFRNFPGVVKSLGAWGGDFVLATSDWGYAKTKEYFNEKGFQVFLRYEDLIL